MDFGYEAFSAHQHFHIEVIKKEFGGLQVGEFLKTYEALYPDLIAVDPEGGWQICQYEGRACIGVFRAYSRDDEACLHLAFVGLDIGRVTSAATMWFRKNRARGVIEKPTIQVAEHRTVYPINDPRKEVTWWAVPSAV
jgi:hypothetical protein